MMNLRFLLLAALAIPTTVHAEPLKLAASVTTRDCERQPICVASAFADLLAKQHAPRELRIDGVVMFEPGTARVYSAGRERLGELAARWKHQSAWTLIVVEGYAFAASDDTSVKLAQQRADRIRHYLVTYGVDPDYVLAVGRGRDPSHAKAGRVDITVELVADEP